MCIRKATINDFPTIRTLPVQLTPRPVTRLLPKQFRVLVQEAAVRLLVFEGTHSVSAFMALRFMPAMDSAIRFMVIVHLGLDRHALRQGIAAEMEERAAALAVQHQCTALLVQARQLPVTAVNFFRERGYELETETLMKKLR